MSAPVTRASAMRWASASSRDPDAGPAAREAAENVRAALGDGPVDLALAFFTAPHVSGARALQGVLQEKLAPGCLVGASGVGVISSSEEIEVGPALSLVVARLPGVGVKPFLLTSSPWNEGLEDTLDFARHAPGAAGAELAMLLADPFSLDADRVLHAFNRHAPGLRVVGGMASAGPRAGSNVLFLNDWISAEGGVAVALDGALRADVVVSQGCRALGPPLEATRVQRNVVATLDGMPAVERIRQVLEALSEPEQRLVRGGLLIGRPARRGAAGRGDYLIRNLVGHDPGSGAIAVGDLVVEGERLRLHVRDAETAREDLELLLSPQAFDSAAHAALLFSCNGRGRNLFPRPHGDVSVLQAALGGVPAAGFFCAGEIGPVGTRNFVHGHTASIAILRPR
jgi:small ligand-binding sensory domain FIST